MKSFVSTEYATGVSFNSPASRPPASELEATKPESLSVFTSNGLRIIGADCAESELLGDCPIAASGRNNTGKSTKQAVLERVFMGVWRYSIARIDREERFNPN